MSKALYESNFNEVTKGKIIVVDFWAEWCGPCVQFGPIVDNVNKSSTGVEIFKCNVDENQKLGAKFGIMAIPTLVVLKDGKEVHRVQGGMSQIDLQELVNKLGK